MRIIRFQARSFRNLQDDVVDVDAPMVVFHGPNGQGKTNALEALGVLGSLRSFRTPRLAEAIPRCGVNAAPHAGLDLRAVARSDGQTRQFAFSSGEQGRRLVREERAVDAVGWLMSLRASWFSPADVAVIRDEPVARRALLDRTILTLNPEYLSVARDHRRVLDQKAALYRSGRATDAELDVLDAQLVPLGARVTAMRRGTVDRISDAFRRLYAEIAGGETAEVRLRSALGEGDEPDLVARYALLVESQRAQERVRRRVLGGAQRDDLLFQVGGQPARSDASQGQARSVVLAWKLAEILAAGESGEVPIFLVDDLGSELDAARTASFVRRLHELGAQVFVSTTDVRAVPVLLGSESAVRVVQVQSGRMS
ncbi:MAG: DNA replication and repair protein RecF [Myxococcales bacterium]|nr:DNA replication and repair protein RecF [Myxococcales bacterium]